MIGVFLNSAPYIIIRGVKIWGVQSSHNGTGVVVKLFYFSLRCGRGPKPAAIHMAWHCYPGHNHCDYQLHVGIRVQPETLSAKKYGGITSPSPDTHPKTITVMENLVCMTQGVSLGLYASHLLFCMLCF